MRLPGRAAAAFSSLAVAALTGCSSPADPPPAAPTPTFAAAGTVFCNEEAFQLQAAGAWAHPQQNFYAPGDPDPPSESDLTHLIAMDSAAVVRYRPDAASADLSALRKWAASAASLVVVPSASRDAAQVEAFTSNRHLICDGVDPAQLTAFADKRGSLNVAPHGDTG